MIILPWMNVIASPLTVASEVPEKPSLVMMITLERMFVARLAVATMLNVPA
jgi:hypothetical protein